MKKSFLKENKGISIIMLVIAVTMMALIVTFAVFSSRNTTTEADFASTYSSLKTVKDACDNAQTLIEINPASYNEFFFFGKSIKDSLGAEEIAELESNCGLEAGEEFGYRTYVIGPGNSDEEKRIRENLELKNIAETYVVDLDNGKYYLSKGIKHKTADGTETVLYEYADMLRAYELLTK